MKPTPGTILLVLLASLLLSATLALSLPLKSDSDRIQLGGAILAAANFVVFTLTVVQGIQSIDASTKQERKQNLLRMLDEWHDDSMGNARQEWFEYVSSLKWLDRTPVLKDVSAFASQRDPKSTQSLLDQVGYSNAACLSIPDANLPDNAEKRDALIDNANMIFDFFDKWASVSLSGSLDYSSLHAAFEEYAMWYQVNFIDVIVDCNDLPRLGVLARRHIQINKIKRIREFLKRIQVRDGKENASRGDADPER